MKKTLLFFICLCAFLFSSMNRFKIVSLELVQPTTKTVEIKGEIQNPGIYEVKMDACVNDVILLAGGLTDKANTDSISLVRKVENREVVVIGKLDESSSQLISINTASKEELETLPGIGPSLASRIIEYRSITPFSCLEDIKNVKGIGDKLFEKIKDRICL